MNKFQPIRTEYKGIVFRSKSEAIFARCLDTSELVGDWEYEPEMERNFGPHPWDFYVLTSWNCPCPTCHCMTQRDHRQILIEYKPSEPTKTYADNLITKVRPKVEQYTAQLGRRIFDSYIVWGSPYGHDFNSDCPEHPYHIYPIFSNHGRFGWGDFVPMMDSGTNRLISSRHDIQEILGITIGNVEEALEYRFDLVHKSDGKEWQW